MLIAAGLGASVFFFPPAGSSAGRELTTAEAWSIAGGFRSAAECCGIAEQCDGVNSEPSVGGSAGPNNCPGAWFYKEDPAVKTCIPATTTVGPGTDPPPGGTPNCDKVGGFVKCATRTTCFKPDGSEECEPDSHIEKVRECSATSDQC